MSGIKKFLNQNPVEIILVTIGSVLGGATGYTSRHSLRAAIVPGVITLGALSFVVFVTYVMATMVEVVAMQVDSSRHPLERQIEQMGFLSWKLTLGLGGLFAGAAILSGMLAHFL